MRCYACDAQNPSHHDGATGRYYCHTCTEVINDTTFSGGMVDLDPDNVTLIMEEVNGEDPYDMPSLWTQGMLHDI